MRSADPTGGSITDCIHGVTIGVRALRDGPDAVGRFAKLFRTLEAAADRVAVVRRRGGRVAGLADAVAWLRQAIEESPALSEPGAEGLRGELLAMLDRVPLGR
jgi:hypothetical protein